MQNEKLIWRNANNNPIELVKEKVTKEIVKEVIEEIKEMLQLIPVSNHLESPRTSF